MSKYADVELSGAERAQVLAEVRAQIAAWGLTMPDVEPLPLDFGLGRFREVGETEFWVANHEEHGYCGKFLLVFDGQTCPHHQHALKHETFFVLKGAITMRVDEEPRTMSQGDTLVMPPGVGHSFRGIGPALILEVSMPSVRRDSFFADRQIGEDGVV